MNRWVEPHGKIANKQKLFKAEQFLSGYGIQRLRLYSGIQICLWVLSVYACVCTVMCARPKLIGATTQKVADVTITN